MATEKQLEAQRKFSERMKNGGFKKKSAKVINSKTESGGKGSKHVGEILAIAVITVVAGFGLKWAYKKYFS